MTQRAIIQKRSDLNTPASSHTLRFIDSRQRNDPSAIYPFSAQFAESAKLQKNKTKPQTENKVVSSHPVSNSVTAPHFLMSIML
jgi:hypothetical protein